MGLLLFHGRIGNRDPMLPDNNMKDRDGLLHHNSVSASAKEQLALVKRVLQLGKQAASKPILDLRSPDEIVGYDEIGLPR